MCDVRDERGLIEFCQLKRNGSKVPYLGLIWVGTLMTGQHKKGYLVRCLFYEYVLNTHLLGTYLPRSVCQSPKIRTTIMVKRGEASSKLAGLRSNNKLSASRGREE